MPFEEYLKNKHAETYTGTDDNMTDSFDKYLMDIDVYEWLELGDEYVKSFIGVDIAKGESKTVVSEINNTEPKICKYTIKKVLDRVAEVFDRHYPSDCYSYIIEDKVLEEIKSLLPRTKNHKATNSRGV